jgi:hypothetical protein
MILGGFFLQCQEPGKGPESEMRLLEICGYDPVNKNFPGEFYFSDGTRFSRVLSITGNAWTFAGKLAMAGRQYRFKATFAYAADSTSATEKTELSTDGKTWTPLGEEKWAKAKPAAKK